MVRVSAVSRWPSPVSLVLVHRPSPNQGVDSPQPAALPIILHDRFDDSIRLTGSSSLGTTRPNGLTESLDRVTLTQAFRSV
jgi:hypothetical protein